MKRSAVTPESLTGRSEQHLCAAADAARLGAAVHRDVVAPLAALCRDAAREGVELRVLSGFRSFERQLSIWNRKAAGQLPVLDSDAVPLDVAVLSETELTFAILRWSALPGASRPHWGTALAVYALSATPEGYEIQLVPGEVEAGGMFAPLHEWLDGQIARGVAHGFFRPYDRDRGGVAPERWHLSYAPTADACARGLTPLLLRDVVERSDLRLKEAVLRHLDEIYERFVINVGGPDA